MCARTPRGKRLLIVETAGLLWLQTVLELERAGAEVRAVAPAAPCIARLANDPAPDAALLRVEGCGGETIEVGCRLRERFPACRLLFAIQDAARCDAESPAPTIARRFGAQALVPIPADTARLVGAILNALDSAAAVPPMRGELLLLDTAADWLCAGLYVFLGLLDGYAFLAPAEIGAAGAAHVTAFRVTVPVAELDRFYRTGALANCE